jgi:hypothetical protein
MSNPTFTPGDIRQGDPNSNTPADPTTREMQALAATIMAKEIRKNARQYPVTWNVFIQGPLPLKTAETKKRRKDITNHERYEGPSTNGEAPILRNRIFITEPGERRRDIIDAVVKEPARLNPPGVIAMRGGDMDNRHSGIF